MPVGKPTDDGEIILGSRHGTHKGGLGPVGAWDCPACGVKNEGRAVEKGCAHCGSGDPMKGKAGGSQDIPAARRGENHPVGVARDVPLPVVERARPVGKDHGAPATRIYRLIEYLVSDPQQVQEVLRRSLVGTMQFPWGQITGAIVDSLDSQQEDRLRMARMQPGVWLGNPVAQESASPQQLRVPSPLRPDAVVDAAVEQFTQLRKAPRVEPPDTGPSYSAHDQHFALKLYDLAESITPGGGYRFIHTLALAQSNVAMELEGNMEPEKFMDSAACTRLANALMHLIPDDWNPQEETDATQS